mmetsp:Transcript_72940/g.207871  ORF Transcript_72940/g.207871 Transcript_72940/m.207871 type:complete len:745 (+) Transcript_72940:182-2416(+)|eukprot:CAMPEP_0119472554 /NCGR_PEP_ID=MMETSP1344-20130328/4564_1 /TAXON_ID=236787 /ORGANISM="Florenciella parvula, Strain CCMP2471" /LENGTH=744 /DNA_ID=CAMNT_0007505519 /DNA_START=150 /DNA_END=2384 /DNA_ORIENTATION=-
MSEEASGEAAPLIEPTAETPLVEGEATETKEDGTAEAEDVEAPASNLEPSIVADFVLVLRADKKPRGKASKEFDFAWQWIESKLSAATRTLDVEVIDVEHESEGALKFVCVTAPAATIADYADYINYPVQFKPEELATFSAETCKLSLSDEMGVTDPWGCYDYIYAAYEEPNEEKAHLKDLWKTPDEDEGIHPQFPSRTRSQLALGIAKSSKKHGGALVKVDTLMASGTVLACFSPNEPYIHEKLEAAMTSIWTMPWNYPVDRVRAYYGEKIAFYFAFGNYYTTALIPLMVMGGLCLFSAASERGDIVSAMLNTYWNFIFSAAAVIWANYFVSAWRDRQAIYAKKWGTLNTEEVQPDRPEYKGVDIPSYIDGSPMKYMSRRSLFYRRAFSTFITFLCICVVIGASATVFYMRWYFIAGPGVGWYDAEVQDSGKYYLFTAKTAASIANAVLVVINSALYGLIVVWLNNTENWRTDAEYSNAYIAKHFVFMAFNSYVALVYIAFVEGANLVNDPCSLYGVTSCLDLVAEQLASLLVVPIFVGQLTDNFIPWISKKCAKADEEDTRTQLEKEFDLEDYDTLLSLNEDYLTLVIQFGYVSMFAAAMPFSPYIAFINNFFEPKNDANKLCNGSRRVIAENAENIGVWASILKGIASVAIVCNLALIVFTGTMFDTWTVHHRFLTFFGGQYVMFAFVNIVIPEGGKPDQAVIQQKRQDFMVPLVLRAVPVEDGHNYDPNGAQDDPEECCA